MNQRGILSHVQNVFFIIFIPPLQSNTLTMNTDEGLSQFNFLYASPRHKTIWMLNTWNKFRYWASLKLIPPWPHHEVDMLSRVIATNLPACPLQNTTSVQH